MRHDAVAPEGGHHATAGFEDAEQDSGGNIGGEGAHVGAVPDGKRVWWVGWGGVWCC